MVTQLPQRTSFSGPALVRLLSRLTQVEVMEPRQSPAARLDEWLGWAESIVLSKVLNAGVPPTSVSTAGANAAPDVINIAELAAAEYTQLRTTLEQAIASAIAPPAPVPGMQRRLVRGASKPAGDVDFPSYRRRYSLLQQKTEDAIAKLRNRFRALLAAQSADLAQLAAVDAAMEQALAEHELRLLAGVPRMLEQRFEQLRDQAASTGGQTPTGGQTLTGRQASAIGDKARIPDDGSAQMAGTEAAAGLGQAVGSRQASAPTAPGPWLDTFRQDMGRVMRAELNLRLQPLEGLLSVIQTDTPEPKQVTL